MQTDFLVPQELEWRAWLSLWLSFSFRKRSCLLITNKTKQKTKMWSDLRVKPAHAKRFSYSVDTLWRQRNWLNSERKRTTSPIWLLTGNVLTLCCWGPEGGKRVSKLEPEWGASEGPYSVRYASKDIPVFWEGRQMAGDGARPCVSGLTAHREGSREAPKIVKCFCQASSRQDATSVRATEISAHRLEPVTWQQRVSVTVTRQWPCLLRMVSGCQTWHFKHEFVRCELLMQRWLIKFRNV